MTTPRTLRISPKLRLPIETITDSITLCARKGMGKTYLAMVFVEECIKAKVPTVVLDLQGVFYGLRSSADGLKPGLPVTILGGVYGDLPLDPRSGREVAELVVDLPSWYILDLSSMTPEEVATFVWQFATRLYTIKGPMEKRDTLLLVVDEAQRLAPQTMRKEGGNVPKMLGAMERIAESGRNRGIGSLWCSQRPAKLNKNVLEQSGVLVAGQITGTNDRKAVIDWFSSELDEDELVTVKRGLGRLQKGEVWVYAPSYVEGLQQVKVRTKNTFDSSKSPEPGRPRKAPKALAKVDLGRVNERMPTAIERAQADDPEWLREQIAILQGQVSTLTSAPPVVGPPQLVEKIVEKPILTDNDRVLMAKIEQQLSGLRDALDVDLTAGFEAVHSVLDARAGVMQDMLKDKATVVDDIMIRYAEILERADNPLITMTSDPAAVQVALDNLKDIDPKDIPAAAPPPEPTRVVIADPNAKLKKGERDLLTALAQHGPLLRQRLGVIAGMSTRGSYLPNMLSMLRGKGYVIGYDPEPVQITAAGHAVLGPVERIAVDPPALREEWKRHKKVSALGGRIIDHLARVGAAPNKESIALALDVDVEGSYLANSLSALRGLGIVTGYGPILLAEGLR